MPEIQCRTPTAVAKLTDSTTLGIATCGGSVLALNTRALLAVSENPAVANRYW